MKDMYKITAKGLSLVVGGLVSGAGFGLMYVCAGAKQVTLSAITQKQDAPFEAWQAYLNEAHETLPAPIQANWGPLLSPVVWSGLLGAAIGAASCLYYWVKNCGKKPSEGPQQRHPGYGTQGRRVINQGSNHQSFGSDSDRTILADSQASTPRLMFAHLASTRANPASTAMSTAPPWSDASRPSQGDACSNWSGIPSTEFDEGSSGSSSADWRGMSNEQINKRFRAVWDTSGRCMKPVVVRR